MQLLQLGRGQGKSTRALNWLMTGDWLSGPGRPLYGTGPELERAQRQATGPWSRAVVVSDVARQHDLIGHLFDRLGRPAPDQAPTAMQSRDWQRVDPLFGPGHLFDKYQVMASQIFLPHALLKHGRDRRIEVAVDELDDVLFALFHHNVALATLTPEETR